VKINVVDTTKRLKVKEGQNINEMNLYHYSYPSEDNYDYHIPTDETLGTLSLNINNLPRLTPEQKKNSIYSGFNLRKIKRSKFRTNSPLRGSPWSPWALGGSPR